MTDVGTIEFDLNGVSVGVPASGSLLDALRESLNVTSAKDGCSPQGQCGCCTVWVDGQARVSCVTPVNRVRNRSVTTVEGLPDADRWAAAFASTGASQCGFCTPGIIMRLAALAPEKLPDTAAVDHGLLAHLCRCTGWQTIHEAAVRVVSRDPVEVPSVDPANSAERARLEGGVAQTVGPAVALGLGGFADDTAPDDALVAMRSSDGTWVVGESLVEARESSGKVQGRRTTAPVDWPVELPTGDWVRTLRTTWVEPAYLEPDASWCEPGGEPMVSVGNGGAFGGKSGSPLAVVARRLADEQGRAVRVLATREDIVRLGPKRPPIAAGIRADGSGVLRAVRTPGLVEYVATHWPDWAVKEVDVLGPSTSLDLRGSVWAELSVLTSALERHDTLSAPNGSMASAVVTDERVAVTVRCGRPLDPVVLRSYCIGAAHMALGWVRSEAITIGYDGTPLDLTIRSFGVLRAVDMPPVDVVVEASDDEPVNGSDAVFAAVAAAAWRHAGFPAAWPFAHEYRR